MKKSVHSGHLNPNSPAGQPDNNAAQRKMSMKMTNKEIVACLTLHPELIPEVMKILVPSERQNDK